MRTTHHTHPTDLADTPARFAAAGLRCTRQRLAVYDALAASRAHPTADELHRLLADHPGDRVALATVYNALEALCHVGLVQKLPGEHGSTRYDVPRNQHAHIKDQHTGHIADVPDHLSRAILDSLDADTLHRLESELGFEVERIELNLVGRALKSEKQEISKAGNA
ncbi:MAG: transcriptional repressor [Planctomycetota bacterium]